MKPQFYLILDFDSTIVGLETLECLAEIVLSNNPNKKQIIDEISNYTNLAMGGKISFDKSLEYRFNLMDVNKNHIAELIDNISNNFDDSFIQNLDFFEKYNSNIYIVSGGFKNIIESVMQSKTHFKWNVFANDFIFNNSGKLIGVDSKNPLAHSLGKVNVIKSLNLEHDIIVVGDGYTDYEIRKYNEAKHFLAYTKHVQRDNVISNSDQNCTDFDQVIDFIKSKYC